VTNTHAAITQACRSLTFIGCARAILLRKECDVKERSFIGFRRIRVCPRIDIAARTPASLPGSK
jgi:hypothetical protein